MKSKGLDIQATCFITSIGIIFALMCLVYGLTFIVPGGYIPFWKWLFSPILILTTNESGTILAVIAFLFVIGGIFNALQTSGLMNYMLDKIVYHFSEKRYELLAIMIFFFMALGSFIGSFEECVPLVPIVVALAIRMGWDDLTGLGMSLLAIGCGFSAGVCNPFTIGVAQSLVGLPMFSGIWFRLICFVVIYIILFFFVFRHAKKIEKPLKIEEQTKIFQENLKMNKSLLVFVCILGVGILLVMSSVFLTALQDYTMIIVAFLFFIAGIASVLTMGMTKRDFGMHFVNGVVSVLPAVLMILMASSIKYTLVEAKILDTILYGAVQVAESLPKELVILFIYLLVLMMNFFISSGSAKAFLLMPLIAPVAQIFELSSQLCVLAFAFGDGFSNVLYPTNPVLLIGLGLANISYTKWLKWTWKFQLMNLVVTSALLLVGLLVGYC